MGDYADLESSYEVLLHRVQVSLRSGRAKGHAVLIGRDSIGKREVALQYRAVDIGEELEIKTDVSTVVDVRIVFCP
jgi:hypothetical protein